MLKLRNAKLTNSVMKNLISLLILLFIWAGSFSQTYTDNTKFAGENYSPRMNFVKTNVTGILLKNYSIQYERVFTKRFSAAISYRNMPEGGLPFRSMILDRMDQDDQEGRDIVNNLMVSNFAITPEIRFYMGKKGYGRGFYIAPFARIAGYEASNFKFNYDDEFGTSQSISLSGEVNAVTFGVMFGAQWSLGKHLVLDWWILGPHAGTGKGDLIGLSTRQLSEFEQNEIRTQLEELDIPMIDKTVTVNSSGATMNTDGLWGGLRAGISFGFKF